jgi:hypothetical protein
MDSLLFATHACMCFFVAGRTNGRKTGRALQGRFVCATAIDLFAVRSCAILQLLLVLLEIFMKCGFDEILEGLGRKEATNEWDGNWNIASRFISNAQEWKSLIVDCRRQEVLEAP